MSLPTDSKLIAGLRWIALLPGSVICAWAACLVLNILGRFSMSYVYVEADSLLAQFYFNTAGSAAMGVAFVYFGTQIAPSHRRATAFVLASIGLVFVGASILAGIMVSNGWAIWSAVCTGVGAGAILYSIYIGETVVD